MPGGASDGCSLLALLSAPFEIESRLRVSRSVVPAPSLETTGHNDSRAEAVTHFTRRQMIMRGGGRFDVDYQAGGGVEEHVGIAPVPMDPDIFRQHPVHAGHLFDDTLTVSGREKT